MSELRASSFSLTEPTPPMPNPTQSKSDWQEALRASINNQTQKVMQATQPHQQDGRDEDVEADERSSVDHIGAAWPTSPPRHNVLGLTKVTALSSGVTLFASSLRQHT